MKFALSRTFMLAICMLLMATGIGCQSTLKAAGTIALPDNRIAFEPLHISVSAVDAQTDIPLEQIVILPKGSNAVPFEISGLQPHRKYYLRYWLLSQGGKGDNFGRIYGNSVQYSFLAVGGLSVLNHAYTKEGFLMALDSADAMTPKENQRIELTGNQLSTQQLTLTCIEEPGVFEATENLLNKLTKPSMDNYQKQWAIYEYCVNEIPNTISKISSYFKSEINDYDNPLTSALLNQEATWLGQPFLMHWLMANLQIESELVEIHPYQSLYPQVVVMSRYDDAYYHSNPLLASVYIDENSTSDPNIYLEKFFNFSINLHENVLSRMVFREEKQRYYGRGAQYPPIKRILSSHQLGESDLVTIACKIALPKGIYGSDQGIWGAVTLTSDSNTTDTGDDLNLIQEFVIGRNKRSHTFKMTVANTGAPVTLFYKDTRFGLTGKVTVNMPIEDNVLVVPVEMTLELPEGF